jgi:hypothetical protein
MQQQQQGATFTRLQAHSLLCYSAATCTPKEVLLHGAVSAFPHDSTLYNTAITAVWQLTLLQNDSTSSRCGVAAAAKCVQLQQPPGVM